MASERFGESSLSKPGAVIMQRANMALTTLQSSTMGNEEEVAEKSFMFEFYEELKIYEVLPKR